MEAKQGKVVHPLRVVTKEKLDLIVADIAEGIPVKYAAESNYMCKTTFYNHIYQGLNDIEADNLDTIDVYLVNSLRNVEKKYILGCLKDIRWSEKGHKGAEWILEHRFWKEFGNSAPVLEIAEELAKLKEEMKGDRENGNKA